MKVCVNCFRRKFTPGASTPSSTHLMNYYVFVSSRSKEWGKFDGPWRAQSQLKIAIQGSETEARQMGGTKENNVLQDERGTDLSYKSMGFNKMQTRQNCVTNGQTWRFPCARSWSWGHSPPCPGPRSRPKGIPRPPPLDRTACSCPSKRSGSVPGQVCSQF